MITFMFLNLRWLFQIDFWPQAFKANRMINNKIIATAYDLQLIPFSPVYYIDIVMIGGCDALCHNSFTKQGAIIIESR